MKTESIQELIELCRTGKCAIKLDACQSGVVAHITKYDGYVHRETSVYLDCNDKEIEAKLKTAVERVQ